MDGILRLVCLASDASRVSLCDGAHTSVAWLPALALRVVVTEFDATGDATMAAGLLLVRKISMACHTVNRVKSWKRSVPKNRIDSTVCRESSGKRLRQLSESEFSFQSGLKSMVMKKIMLMPTLQAIMLCPNFLLPRSTSCDRRKIRVARNLALVSRSTFCPGVPPPTHSCGLCPSTSTSPSMLSPSRFTVFFPYQDIPRKSTG